MKLIQGDCIEVMKTLDANSVDTVITDPPYGLEFMGKEWDSFKDNEKFQEWTRRWALQAYRIAKPGAFMLCFGGTRTFHRIACGIEDAGWEIRDTVMWLYGSGFPKSHNISKAIDKTNGETGRKLKFTKWMRTTGLTTKYIDDELKRLGMISPTSSFAIHYFNDGQPAIPTADIWRVLRPHIDNVPDWVDLLIERIEAEREVVGKQTKARNTEQRSALPTMGDGETEYKTWDLTAPATDQAKTWDGWGTALKPAFEPIIVAMKPRDGTFAENALKWGVAGLNIDGGRVPTEDTYSYPNGAGGSEPHHMERGLPKGDGKIPQTGNELGRFPANIIHDGSEEVLAGFPQSKTGSIKPHQQNSESDSFGMKGKFITGSHQASSGSAARFFYCAKASKAERNAGLAGMEEVEAGRSTSRSCVNCGKPIAGMSQKEKCVCDNRQEQHPKYKTITPP